MGVYSVDRYKRVMLVEREYDYVSVLRRKLDEDSLSKLMRIRNPEIHRWIADIVLVAEPSKVFIVTDDPRDHEYVRQAALRYREEIPTRNPRHTVHFDGPHDIARDRKNTRILITWGSEPLINTLDRELGLREVKELFHGVMRGREMFVGFFCLGPRNSPFTLYAVQVTDSAYVMHSELILYRTCYEVFVDRGEEIEYLRFLHSTGERDPVWGWSRNVEKRRIYIDLLDNTTYSVNTQYAGNTVGLKKLALRHCIYRGYLEGWLCEHMFIAGIRGPGNRITYFTGAFPAGCGKTSTALIADTIISDDLAIIRCVDGIPRAINPEIGMFGIIDGINPRDDPEIYRILTSLDTEVIFSNVLLTNDGDVWWRGKEGEPREGINWSGKWWPGKDELPSHPNARFTTHLRYLANLDPRIEDPMGVPIEAMVFGGRDSDTWVPIEEAFDWVHGIVTKGAALESERTAAVLGKTGVREFNPFAILDFLPISPGKFVELHIRFGKKLTRPPKIFGVNYFLKDEHGRYLSEKTFKRVWLKWMELRVHDDVDAVESPTGYVPLYEDLRKLFDQYLCIEYSEQLYEKQFTVRIPQHLAKIERVWRIYEEKVPDTPRIVFDVLREQKMRLEAFRDRFGDYVSPFKLDRV